MDTLLKNLGVILLLIGVGILAVPAFTDMRNNWILGGGLLIVIIGFLTHIFLNKKFE
ncbi:MAG: hypothetical protein LBC19_08305 [Tannerella sp.]|jgi:uncharacterized membrane protein HdeD (DUF308 family)|nr:hypothetical protein [Tannerella sp.]